MKRPLWAYACWAGLHQWHLYSIVDLVWPVESGHTRLICRRCRKRRTRR